MRVFDCFLFNDELDLLELRLMELGAVVDVFVLCEMGHNFRMQPKPLHYHRNMDRFSRWHHRIRHLVVRDYPIAPHPAIEVFQRRSLANGFSDGQPGDIILYGDADEVPRAEFVEKFKEKGVDRPLTLQQRLYYYTVDFATVGKRHDWAGTVALPYRPGLDLHVEREQRHYNAMIPDAGWHFSWLGTAEQIAAKLRAIDVDADSRIYGTADTIKAPDPEDLNYLELCTRTGRDLFGREPLRRVPIEPGVRQPRMIEVWLDKYPQYAERVNA